MRWGQYACPHTINNDFLKSFSHMSETSRMSEETRCHRITSLKCNCMAGPQQLFQLGHHLFKPLIFFFSGSWKWSWGYTQAEGLETVIMDVCSGLQASHCTLCAPSGKSLQVESTMKSRFAQVLTALPHWTRHCVIKLTSVVWGWSALTVLGLWAGDLRVLFWVALTADGCWFEFLITRLPELIFLF